MRHYTLNPALAFVPFVEIDASKSVEADARDSGHRSAALASLLSKDHNSRPAFKLKVWIDGSLADCPCIPNHHSPVEMPFPPSDGHDISKRGQVREFSGKSRNRFKRVLATMIRTETAYTMALTLPGGDISMLSHQTVMKAFKTLKGRLSSVARFARISGYWKREIQQRGAIHYHLIIYGLSSDSLREEFQTWMVRQWNSLICVGLTEKQIEEHRWWHARPENMEVVMNTAYFAKYVGKSEAAGELTGRWWGAFNGTALPVSKVLEVELPEQARVMMHRLARKRRQKLADSGKHNAIRKLVKKKTGFDVSQTDLWRLRSGFRIERGGRSVAGASLYLECYGQACAAAGVRPGKAGYKRKKKRENEKNPPVTARVVLCDATAPAFAIQALSYVSKTLKLPLDLHETPSQSWKNLTPCPLKPVPPGREPIRRERYIEQADFIERLSLGGKKSK